MCFWRNKNQKYQIEDAIEPYDCNYLYIYYNTKKIFKFER